MTIINMAIKHPNVCHSGESRNPGKDWMPDQVRHDVLGTFCCQISNRWFLPLFEILILKFGIYL